MFRLACLVSLCTSPTDSALAAIPASKFPPFFVYYSSGVPDNTPHLLFVYYLESFESSSSPSVPVHSLRYIRSFRLSPAICPVLVDFPPSKYSSTTLDGVPSRVSRLPNPPSLFLQAHRLTSNQVRTRLYTHVCYFLRGVFLYYTAQFSRLARE